MTKLPKHAPVDREALLTAWQAKAGCFHSQEEASRRWRALTPVLPQYWRRALRSAQGHHRIRQGRSEIDYVCGLLKQAWRDEAKL